MTELMTGDRRLPILPFAHSAYIQKSNYCRIMRKSTFLPSLAVWMSAMLFSASAGAQNPYIKSILNIDSINGQLRLTHKASERFDLVNRKSGYYLAVGLIDSMDRSTQEMLKLAQELRNDSLLIAAYNMIGDYFLFKGNYSSALEYLFKGLRLAEKTGISGYGCSLTADISDTYRSTENIEEALKYARRSLLYLRDSALFRTTLPSQVYQTFTLDFLKLGQNDSALHYGQKGIEESMRMGDPFQYAWVLNDFALVYESMHEPLLSESYFKKAIAYADSLHLWNASATVRGDYAHFLFEQGNAAAALTQGQLSFNEARSSGNYVNLVARADLLKRIYEKLDRKDSVFQYALLKDMYVDSVDRESKAGKVHDIIVNDRLHEIEEAGKQLRAEEERRNNLQYAAIAIGMITFLILFFLLSHSVMANQKLIRALGIIALLIVFEFLNLFLHPYLGDWTHHSPVYMLLVMVCIAALLVPLHHRMEHWITHRLVEKNNRIRLAAAKKTIAKLERNS